MLSLAIPIARPDTSVPFAINKSPSEGCAAALIFNALPELRP